MYMYLPDREGFPNPDNIFDIVVPFLTFHASQFMFYDFNDVKKMIIDND